MARILSCFPPLLLIATLAGCGPEKDDTGADDTGDSTSTGSVDRDGDGVTADEDCDDHDPDVYPGAVDICNGVDDDCDEEVDEDPDVMWYVDEDGDGFGDSGDEVGPSCEATDGYVANYADCDDGDSLVFPGATEDCDGVDNNCDGEADEGAATYVATGGSEDGTGSVDDPMVSIQSAIESGAACISVGPGVYKENLRVVDGPLWLFGADGSADTVIDAEYSGSALFVGDRSGEDISISGFTLQNGDTNYGGGLYVFDSVVSFSDMLLTGNWADYDGGAIYLDNSTVSFDGLVVTDNLANQGAGMNLYDSVATVTDGSFTDNEAYYGGALVLAYSTADMVDCTVSDNTAYYDGGALYAYESEWTFEGGEISSNTADDYSGGGVALYGGNSTLTDTSVSDNVADYDDGAGLYLYGASVTLSGVDVVGNTSTYGSGGGIAAIYATDIQADDVTISDNESTYGEGGGLYLYYQASFVGDGIVIAGNNVGTSSGGGFNLDYDSYLELVGSSIESNTGYSFAGGVVDGSEAVISSSTIKNNDGTYVGGLGVRDYGTLTLTNTVFHSNSDGSSSGGSSYFGAAVTATTYSVLNISFSTIVNTIGTYALTLHQNAYLDLNNSILAYNNGYGLYLSSATSSYLSGGYNDFYENAYDNHYGDADGEILENQSIEQDPDFSSYSGAPESDDLHLSAGSPCEDAGDPNENDADGSRADMGAYGGSDGDW